MSVASPSSKSEPIGRVFDRIGDNISSAYDYSLNVHFEDGRLLSGILVSLLYLTVALSLDAAGYVPSMGLLLPVTLGALGLGFLMSYSRFDGFFAISHSMFVGLGWILYLMTGLVAETEIASILNNGIPELQARAYLILIEWVDWIRTALAGTPENDNYVFIFEICFLVWWLTYLGVWSIYRYGYTWRAIIPAGAVLLINTYYAPQSVIGFLVIFSLISLVLLVRTHLAELQLRWRERRIHFNPDISLDFLRNGLAFSIAVIAMAWLAPSLGKNLQVRQILAPVNDRWESFSESLNELYPSLNRRTRPTAAAFGPKLTLSGARNFGNSRIFSVDADKGRYWRAVTYDTYTGTEWFNTSETTVEFDAGDMIPVGDWNLREPLTQTITLLAPTGNVVFGAPDIIRSTLPLEAHYNPVANRPVAGSITPAGFSDDEAIELTMTRTSRSLETGESYTVVSWQTDITQRALREAGEVYPSEEFVERYTQLPENFSDRVRQTAIAETAGAETVYDKASRLETFLRQIEYDEQIPAPPPGTDPIEYFLYEIQRGYCDYYATSMVTMLRSLGIPARTASGYAEGSYQSPDGSDEDPLSPVGVGDGVYVISERDAHTWVEVYFPQFGWVEFEPTAGETLLTRPEGNDEENLAAFMPPIPLDNPFNDDPLMDEQMMEELMGGSGGGLGLDTNATFAQQWPWWTGLGIILMAIVGGWFFLRSSRLIGPTSFATDLPPILFDRMHNWAVRLGIFPVESDTPFEQANRLARALPQGQRPIEQITESYVHYQYSPNAHSQFDGVNRGFNYPDGVLPSGETRILANTMDLPQNWKVLQSIFIKAWLAKVFGRFGRNKKDPFALSG